MHDPGHQERYASACVWQLLRLLWWSSCLAHVGRFRLLPALSCHAHEHARA